MSSYRLFSKWSVMTRQKAAKLLRRKRRLKSHYIPTRDWYILATWEEWELRTRLTIDYLIEQKLQAVKK